MTLKPCIRYLLLSSCVILSACTEDTVIHEANSNNTDPQSLADALAPSSTFTENNNGTTSGADLSEAIEESISATETGQVTSSSADNQNTTQNPPVTNTGISTSDQQTNEEPTTNAVNQTDLTETISEGEDTPGKPASADSETSPSTDTLSNNTNSAESSIPLTEESVTVGAPGETVNCVQTLPCRWVSADNQFEVTITSSDNIGVQDRLTIEYSIQTSHDTEIFISNAEAAVDGNGASFEPSALLLGESNGRAIVSVTAGTVTQARIEFDASSDASTLTNWTIGFSDAGLIRQPSFTGIPVSDATSLQIDCDGSLPCVWISPDKKATVTLLSVHNSGSTNQLTANFKIETAQDTTVAVNNGTFAIDTEGLSYMGRTHGFGLENSGEEVTATAFAGAFVAGNVFFFRTQSAPTMLQLLSLVAYEDKPVPRWNPEFLSVPVQ